jgi:amphi-Trp domain-containing protein
MTRETRLGADPLARINGPAGAGAPPASAPEPAEADARCPGPVAPAFDYVRIFYPGDQSASEDSMGKSKKIKLEETLPTSQALAHLQDVVDSMKTGLLLVESGEDSLGMPVPEAVEFEMKVGRKKDKAKCSFSLEWRIDPEAEKPGVSIGGKEED